MITAAWRRLLGLGIAPLVLCTTDAVLTLAGQSAAYWRGTYHVVNEGSPTFHHLLTIHPAVFALGIATWMVIFLCLIFLLPGMDETVRVNGTAKLSVDPELLESMAVEGKKPKCAIVIEVREAYLHCAKAFRRSKLWDPATRIDRSALPSLACMMRDQIGLSEEATNQAEARIEKAYRESLWAPLP